MGTTPQAPCTPLVVVSLFYTHYCGCYYTPLHEETTSGETAEALRDQPEGHPASGPKGKDDHSETTTEVLRHITTDHAARNSAAASNVSVAPFLFFLKKLTWR
jgi:hypothetical protein